jgi:hypothetical protein
LNTSRIAFFLLTLAVALPQANAQYAGSLPAESATSHAADAAPSPATLQAPSSIASIVAPLAPAAVPAKLPAKNLRITKESLSPSSLKLLAPSSASPRSLYDAPKRLSKVPLGLKPPAGSKKGHWVDAPVFSMSGMPQWVEDK